MCTINFVNPRPTGQAVATVEAQIRPYIRERWRADLFQSPPLIALSNSSLLCLFRVRPLPPLFLYTLYLLIPLHSPKESSFCTGAGSLTEAERWIWLRVTWFCLSVWPGLCPNTEPGSTPPLSLHLRARTPSLSPLLHWLKRPTWPQQGLTINTGSSECSCVQICKPNQTN